MDDTFPVRHMSRQQFSLRALFEYTTLCCLLAAMSSGLGIGPSVCLMLLGLALTIGQGLLSLGMLGAAVIAVAFSATPGGDEFNRLSATVLAAGGVCGWYRWRAQSSGVG